MKNLKEELGGWVALAAIPGMFLALAGAVETQVVSRQQITVDGIVENVIVWRGRRVGLELRDIRFENGHFVTHTGVLAPRGRPPLTWDRPSTPHEIAVYRAVL